jgi:hypothetical protein
MGTCKWTAIFNGILKVDSQKPLGTIEQASVVGYRKQQSSLVEYSERQPIINGNFKWTAIFGGILKVGSQNRWGQLGSHHWRDTANGSNHGILPVDNHLR